MIEMMFIEHVLLALFLGSVAAVVFVAGAVLAQLVDVDHVLNSASDVTFYEKFNRALDSLPLSTSDGYFEESSMGLYRGFLHRPIVFFSSLFIVIGLVGFMFGWFIHLASDGVTILSWGGL